MRTRRAVLRTAGVTILATSCAIQRAPENGEAGAGAIQYELQGRADGAPTGCEIATLGSRVEELFASIAAGRQGMAEEFFGESAGAPFQWFSLTDRDRGNPPHWVTYSTDGLEKFLATRTDRWVLKSIKFNDWDEDRGLVHFGPVTFNVVIHETAGDAQNVRYGQGKGAYHCDTAAFVVLSLGLSDQPPLGWSDQASAAE